MRSANLVVIMSDEHHSRAMGPRDIHLFEPLTRIGLPPRGTRFTLAYSQLAELPSFARLVRHRPLPDIEVKVFQDWESL